MNYNSGFGLFLFLGLATIFPQNSKAQLTIVQGSEITMTPLEFVQTYLAGPGVTISNATYNGSALPLNIIRDPAVTADAIGSFTALGTASQTLGLEGGIMLASGRVQDASATVWPNGHANFTVGSGGDPDLTLLAGITSRDKSILEFDFVPATDVISFRYVFGSEEFDEFCNQFNDSFGFFIRGPGIPPGPFAGGAQNIAHLPSSLLFVTINNICATDNGVPFGTYSWWNGNGPIYNYDRLTYVFTASISVQCTQTYHLKLAVGDASDTQYDSGIFLEENSLTSNSFTGNTTFSNPQTGQLLVEGCNDVTMYYEIPQPLTSDLTINLSIDLSGTATQADILPNPLPASLTIPVGMLQTPPITIIPVIDGTPEPLENLVITASSTVCGLTNTVTTEFPITDYDPLTVILGDITACDGSPDTLNAVAHGGQPVIPSNDYHYLWSTGATTSSIIVNPGPGHHTYTVSVTDACSQSAVVSSSVDVGTVPGNAEPINGTDSICTPANGLLFSVPVIPGADDYIWSLPPGVTIVSGNNTNSITVNMSTAAASGMISVYGHSTYCGDGQPAALPLTINPGPEPAGPITGPSSVCQGPDAVVYLISPLNFTETYDWTVPPGVQITSGAGTNQITCLFTTSAVSGNFTVRGYNTACSYGIPASKAINVDPLPGDAGVITSPEGSVVCQRQTGVAYSVAPIPDASAYLWNYSGTGVSLTNNGASVLIDFSASATSGILTVKARNNCGDGTLSSPFPVTVNPRPTVGFNACNPVITTKNGRPIRLRGGFPEGSGGVYSGTGVSMTSPGIYVFDPANINVTGGGATFAVNHQVLYRYTNTQGCFDDQSILISVYGSNANDPCPGTVKDHRDGKSYPTFLAGTGANAKCWMASNLNFGTYTDQAAFQADNCYDEKYCRENTEALCASSGGYYQWGEIMEYQDAGDLQDICPPGWHVPASSEWQELINTMNSYIPADGLAGSSLKDMNPAVGFHGLLSGVYYLNNSWSYTSGVTGAFFWTSSRAGGKSVARGLNQINPSVSYYESSGSNAFPVRCIIN